MQRNGLQLSRPLYFVGFALIFLVAWYAPRVRKESRFDAEHMELSRPLLQSIPKSRFIEEPLPLLKPVGKLSSSTRHTPAQYHARALPIGFTAYDLNDQGIVAGSISIRPGIYNVQDTAVFWERGKVTRLTGNRNPVCCAGAVNESGTIAGEIGVWSSVLTGDSGNDVVLWQTRTPNTFMPRSVTLPEIYHPRHRVVRINRWGQLIGNAGAGTSIDRPTLESLGSRYGIQSENARSADTHQLSFFRDGEKICLLNTGAVYGLNDLGQVVGTEALEEKVKTTTSDGFEDYTYLPLPERAVLYQGARINTLWEAPKTAIAYAINNRQHVVGVQGDYPVRWEGGKTARLPFVSGTTCGVAQDINDRDQIVGHCGKDASQRAVIWQSGSVWDLNWRLVGKPRVLLTEASRVNEAGQVLACDRSQRWYLLTPTR